MPTLWYAILDNKQSGPHAEDQVRNMVRTGRIGPATLVWHDGLSGWKPASEVGLIGATPQPPLTPAAPDAAKRQSPLFGSITDRDEAVATVRASAAALLAIAAVRILGGLIIAGTASGSAASVLAVGVLIESALMIGLAIWLRQALSRVAAVLLLILACADALAVLFNLSLIALIVGVVGLWASIRAVMATFKLKDRFGAPALS